MENYPKARWSVSPASVGASVWTRNIPEDEGGGYYLYTWKRDAAHITVEELVQGVTKEERQWPIGKRSVYAVTATIPVPDPVRGQDQHGQEIGVARLIHADIRKRFREIAEWIPYDSSGKPVWFHGKVVGE